VISSSVVNPSVVCCSLPCSQQQLPLLGPSHSKKSQNKIPKAAHRVSHPLPALPASTTPANLAARYENRYRSWWAPQSTTCLYCTHGMPVTGRLCSKLVACYRHMHPALSASSQTSVRGTARSACHGGALRAAAASVRQPCTATCTLPPALRLALCCWTTTRVRAPIPLLQSWWVVTCRGGPAVSPPQCSAGLEHPAASSQGGLQPERGGSAAAWRCLVLGRTRQAGAARASACERA